MTPFVYIVPLKTLKVNVKSVKINNKLESNMLNKNRKVAFHTLGCKVNSYETEAMRNQLEQNGYEIADFKPGADIYIINTCTVTNIADRKSRQMLHKAKKMNKDAVVIAVGCYVQAAGEELLKDEAIDIVVGSNRKSEIVHIIEEYYAGKDHSYLSDISKSCEYDDMEMSSLAERTRAFIKIQDGVTSSVPTASSVCKGKNPQQKTGRYQTGSGKTGGKRISGGCADGNSFKLLRQGSGRKCYLVRCHPCGFRSGRDKKNPSRLTGAGHYYRRICPGTF